MTTTKTHPHDCVPKPLWPCKEEGCSEVHTFWPEDLTFYGGDAENKPGFYCTYCPDNWPRDDYDENGWGPTLEEVLEQLPCKCGGRRAGPRRIEEAGMASREMDLDRDERLCPLMSHPRFTMGGGVRDLMKCVGSHCAMWVTDTKKPEIGRCGMPELGDTFPDPAQT